MGDRLGTSSVSGLVFFATIFPTTLYRGFEPASVELDQTRTFEGHYRLSYSFVASWLLSNAAPTSGCAEQVSISGRSSPSSSTNTSGVRSFLGAIPDSFWIYLSIFPTIFSFTMISLQS